MASWVIDDVYTNFNTTFYSTAELQEKNWCDHNVNVLPVITRNFLLQDIRGSRVTFPATALNELNAGSATGQTARGTASEWQYSRFSVVLIMIRSKYLFEANARYDGTSRIHPDTRWVSSRLYRQDGGCQRILHAKSQLARQFKLRASWVS